jgi:hypothetical protein
MHIPSVHVLAYHRGIDADVPHHGRTMPIGFETVVHLLSLVGTFFPFLGFGLTFPSLGAKIGYDEEKERTEHGCGIVNNSV